MPWAPKYCRHGRAGPDRSGRRFELRSAAEVEDEGLVFGALALGFGGLAVGRIRTE